MLPNNRDFCIDSINRVFVHIFTVIKKLVILYFSVNVSVANWNIYNLYYIELSFIERLKYSSEMFYIVVYLSLVIF